MPPIAMGPDQRRAADCSELAVLAPGVDAHLGRRCSRRRARALADPRAQRGFCHHPLRQQPRHPGAYHQHLVPNLRHGADELPHRGHRRHVARVGAVRVHKNRLQGHPEALHVGHCLDVHQLRRRCLLVRVPICADGRPPGAGSGAGGGQALLSRHRRQAVGRAAAPRGRRGQGPRGRRWPLRRALVAAALLPHVLPQPTGGAARGTRTRLVRLVRAGGGAAAVPVWKGRRRAEPSGVVVRVRVDGQAGRADDAPLGESAFLDRSRAVRLPAALHRLPVVHAARAQAG